MSKYLYGASVQGIQNFIFQTNKLKEIIGGSELVEKVCTNIFQDVVLTFLPENLIIGAAGNIKYIFDKKEDCEELVSRFPKIVMREAPGISVSQAVVEIAEDEVNSMHIKLLEKKLRIQRNKPVVQHGLGLMVSERARRTGGAGVAWSKDEIVDLGQWNKIQYAEGRSKYSEGSTSNSLMKKVLGEGHPFRETNFPFDISDIVKGRKNSWIAVVHADGNNLGKLLLKMSDTLTLAPEKTQEAFRVFSIKLEEATIKAASNAFFDIIGYKMDHSDSKAKIPFRPVILSGDDLTVIVRGDLALDFTNRFLKLFEDYTKETFSDFGKEYKLEGFESGLTACAGIAYIKPKYPFHYAVELCEDLCKYSKKIAKKIDSLQTPSCVTFHKVQASFTESYSDIIKLELEGKSENGKGLGFNYGPYFLEKQDSFSTIDDLKFWAKEILRDDAPRGPIRNWIGDLRVDRAKAEQSLLRIKTLNRKYVSRLSLENAIVEKGKNQYTHLYDVLTLSTIENIQK